MYIDLIKRKTDQFTASHERVDAQKLSRVFAMCVCVMYMSCSAKTVSCFCNVYVEMSIKQAIVLILMIKDKEQT